MGLYLLQTDYSGGHQGEKVNSGSHGLRAGKGFLGLIHVRGCHRDFLMLTYCCELTFVQHLLTDPGVTGVVLQSPLLGK